ncbi:MAG: hypothetical protein RBS80_24970 [Thermoguttaceae bacterium]|nr:hypothetical protein [Thermoguttaceae bacterium]
MFRCISLHIAVSVLFAASACTARPEPTHATKTFDGASTDLKSTEVVPILEAEIPTGVNAVWCSSFLAAWKSMSEDLAGELKVSGTFSESASGIEG